MKVAVVGGRTTLVIDDRIVDAAQASDGAIPAEPAAMFAAWPDLQRLTQDLKGPEFYAAPGKQAKVIDIARPGSECLPRGRPPANQRPSAIRGSVALGLPRFTTVALEDKTVPGDTGGSGPWRRRRVTGWPGRCEAMRRPRSASK